MAETGLAAVQCAASGGHCEPVRLLIRRGALLEAVNMYGGTVLSQALWSAIHEAEPENGRVIEELIAAGAEVGAVRGMAVVEDVLSRHRESV